MTIGTRSAETLVAGRRLAEGGQTHWTAVLADYWTLTKPEVNFLIVITTLAGFSMGSPPGSVPARWLLLFNTLVGTLFVASGTGTLNQYIERHFDAQMRRTARRPLPGGRVTPLNALWFGVLLSVVGDLYLAVLVNFLASLLAILTLLTYLFLYTPLKRKTPLCTLVGAFPGAAPPLIGWAGARGSLSTEALLLYAILFLWQFPHFMSIAWMYREDYARAGYLTLPRGKSQGCFMAWQTLVFSLALIPVSVAPAFLQRAGFVYFIGALVLGSGFFYYAARLALFRSNTTARRLLLASIVYLPLTFGLMVFGKALLWWV
jgi:protoheme IX farnesyltransferase